MNVTKLRRKFRHQPPISARQMYNSPEPTNLMVWAVCPYIDKKVNEDECDRCPAWDEDEEHGKCKRGCRALAEEVCRLVMAGQRLAAVLPEREE